MKTVTSSARLPCSAETFWKLFFDERYTRALFMEELGFKDFAVLEQTERSRKLRLVPKVNMPAVIQKVIGDAFGYEEHGSFDRARNEWTWRMVPKKEIVATRGRVRIEPVSDTECVRNDEVIIEGKMFGVGGLIESTAEKEVRASWPKEIAFLERQLRDRAGRG
jgi:hypothetical protein